jgi:hypothetical protein
MKIDRRITGGLAWAGLVVILAVPSADILFGKPEVRASITSDISAVTPAVADESAAPAATGGVDPIETASIPEKPAAATTPAKAAPAAADPQKVATAAPQVPSAPAQVPATTQTAVPTDVAITGPAAIDPPIPMPRNMRPLPPTVIPPQQTVTVATTNEVQPTEDAPLIIDENRAPPQRQATNRRSSDFFGPSEGGQVVTEDKLAAWNSGSLSDYLQRNGLLDDGAPSDQQFDDSYDPDGFFLSDGPEQRPRRPYYQRPREDNWFF